MQDGTSPSRKGKVMDQKTRPTKTDGHPHHQHCSIHKHHNVQKTCCNTTAPLPSRGPIWVVVPRPPSSHPDGRGQQAARDGHQHHPKTQACACGKKWSIFASGSAYLCVCWYLIMEHDHRKTLLGGLADQNGTNCLMSLVCARSIVA